MAKYSSVAAIYVGTLNTPVRSIGTATRSWKVTLEAGALDQTAVTDAGEKVLAGHRKDAFTWSGLFDDDASVDALMGSMPTPLNIIGVFIGTATGSVGYSFVMTEVSVKPSAKLGELVAQEFVVSCGTGAIQLSKVLSHQWDTGTVTGTSGSVDGGAATTSGFTWYVFAHDVGTASTMNVRLLHSTSGTGTWESLTLYDLGTPGRGTGVYVLNLGSGTVYRYVRMEKQSTGTLLVSQMFTRQG